MVQWLFFDRTSVRGPVSKTRSIKIVKLPGKSVERRKPDIKTAGLLNEVTVLLGDQGIFRNGPYGNMGCISPTKDIIIDITRQFYRIAL